MSEAAPNLYTGLDQLIAKPTKAETVPVPMPDGEEAEQKDAAAATPDVQGEKQEKTAVNPATEANLVRQLEPDLPDSPDLYRKQTINFGPEDLEAVQKMQQALRDGHDHDISKQDIVRAAIEFLLKDHESHKENSFVIRKFVRR